MDFQCATCRRDMSNIYKTTSDVASNYELIKIMEFLIKENRLQNMIMKDKDEKKSKDINIQNEEEKENQEVKEKKGSVKES